MTSPWNPPPDTTALESPEVSNLIGKISRLVQKDPMFLTPGVCAGCRRDFDGYEGHRNAVVAFVPWRLSPVANCPRLPVNGQRNEG